MKPFDWQKWLLIMVILAAAIGGMFFLQSRHQPETTVAVPAKALPAYHLITASDLITTTLSAIDLPAKSRMQISELTGQYTNQPLPAEKPVTEAHLVPFVDEKYVLDTTAVSMPATAAMTYNGHLTPSTIVTVWTVSDTEQMTPLLDEVLVLDVQKVEVQNEAGENGFPYVVLLAVPNPKRAALLTAESRGSLMLTLAP